MEEVIPDYVGMIFPSHSLSLVSDFFSKKTEYENETFTLHCTITNFLAD